MTAYACNLVFFFLARERNSNIISVSKLLRCTKVQNLRQLALLDFSFDFILEGGAM